MISVSEYFTYKYENSTPRKKFYLSVLQKTLEIIYSISLP